MAETTEIPATLDRDLQKRLIFAWLDALRSGEWKQCRESPERPGEGNCCLGIAIRIIEREIPGSVRAEVGASSVAFWVRGERQVTSLPVPAMQCLGIKTCSGRWRSEDEDEEASLMAANDSGGKSFPEIADLIETHAATLFVNGPEVAQWLSERGVS